MAYVGSADARPWGVLPTAPSKEVGVTVVVVEALPASLPSTLGGEAVSSFDSEMVWTSESVMVSVEVPMPEPVDDLAQPWHFCPAINPGTAVDMRARSQASHICAATVGSASGILVFEVYDAG